MGGVEGERRGREFGASDDGEGYCCGIKKEMMSVELLSAATGRAAREVVVLRWDAGLPF